MICLESSRTTTTSVVGKLIKLLTGKPSEQIEEQIQAIVDFLEGPVAARGSFCESMNHL